MGCSSLREKGRTVLAELQRPLTFGECLEFIVAPRRMLLREEWRLSCEKAEIKAYSVTFFDAEKQFQDPHPSGAI